MTTLQKVLIGIFGALFIGAFFIYKGLCNVPEETPTPVVYPESGLSDNLFVSQNSKYVENSSLNSLYAFNDVPYYIDMPEGDTAEVGSGHIVYGSDNYCFYISEIDDTISCHEAVLSQYAPVVYMNYSQNSSYIQTVKEDFGYINGLTANYFVDHLLISTGVNTSARSAYVIGYCFDLKENSEWNIIVSVATNLEDTESFAKCKEMLDVLAYTIRYDEKLDAMQIKAREDAIKQAEREAEAARKEAEASAAKGTTTTAVHTQTTGNVRSVPVEVTHDFNDLSIIVTWTNSTDKADITFVSDDGLVTLKPSMNASKQAMFNVGPCSSDKKYSLNVTGYETMGDISLKLIENKP